MKAFLKFIGVIASVFIGAVGALAVFDKLAKKEYYICNRFDEE